MARLRSSALLNVAPEFAAAAATAGGSTEVPPEPRRSADGRIVGARSSGEAHAIPRA